MGIGQNHDELGVPMEAVVNPAEIKNAGWIVNEGILEVGHDEEYIINP
jgi:hypothetical protein